MARISSEDFAAAVESAGGEGAAAGLLGVSVASVKRWQRAMPDHRQPLVRRTMGRYLPGAPPPPIRQFSSEDLLDELAFRLRSEWRPDLAVSRSGHQDHESTTTPAQPETPNDNSHKPRGRLPTVVSKRKPVNGDGKGNNQRDKGIQEDG